MASGQYGSMLAVVIVIIIVVIFAIFLVAGSFHGNDTRQYDLRRREFERRRRSLYHKWEQKKYHDKYPREYYNYKGPYPPRYNGGYVSKGTVKHNYSSIPVPRRIIRKTARPKFFPTS